MIDSTNKKVVALENSLSEGKEIYDKELLDQKKAMDKMQKEMNKMQKKLEKINLQKDRENWIIKNAHSFEGDFAGGALGLAGGSYGVAAAAVVLGITQPPILGGMVLGAYQGVSVSRKLQKSNLKEQLKSREEVFLRKNPSASRMEAFKQASKDLELLLQQ